MGRYVKESCPKCNKVLSGWHRDAGLLEIGEPLFKCPYCNAIIIKKNRAEFIMFNPWLYFRYFIWPILSSLIISYVIGLLLGYVFFSKSSYVIYSIIFGIIIFSLFMLQMIKNFKREKKESLERTKDINYLTALYSIKAYITILYDIIKRKK